MRVASQKEALGWNRLVMPTDRLDGVCRGFVPLDFKPGYKGKNMERDNEGETIRDPLARFP